MSLKAADILARYQYLTKSSEYVITLSQNGQISQWSEYYYDIAGWFGPIHNYMTKAKIHCFEPYVAKLDPNTLRVQVDPFFHWTVHKPNKLYKFKRWYNKQLNLTEYDPSDIARQRREYRDTMHGNWLKNQPRGSS